MRARRKARATSQAFKLTRSSTAKKVEASPQEALAGRCRSPGMSSSRRLQRGGQQPDDGNRIQEVDAALVSDRAPTLDAEHRGKSLGLGLRPSVPATHSVF